MPDLGCSSGTSRVYAYAKELLFDGVGLGRYWELVTAALYLLLPVDLITTVYAVKVVGIGSEVNPLMIWLLQQGTGTIIIVHMTALLVVVAAFRGYEVVSSRSEQYEAMMRLAVKTYLLLLVGSGFLVFVNNLAVIFFRQSLF